MRSLSSAIEPAAAEQETSSTCFGKFSRLIKESATTYGPTGLSLSYLLDVTIWHGLKKSIETNCKHLPGSPEGSVTCDSSTSKWMAAWEFFPMIYSILPPATAIITVGVTRLAKRFINDGNRIESLGRLLRKWGINDLVLYTSTTATLGSLLASLVRVFSDPCIGSGGDASQIIIEPQCIDKVELITLAGVPAIGLLSLAVFTCMLLRARCAHQDADRHIGDTTPLLDNPAMRL